MIPANAADALAAVSPSFAGSRLFARTGWGVLVEQSDSPRRPGKCSAFGSGGCRRDGEMDARTPGLLIQSACEAPAKRTIGNGARAQLRVESLNPSVLPRKRAGLSRRWREVSLRRLSLMTFCWTCSAVCVVRIGIHSLAVFALIGGFLS